MTALAVTGDTSEPAQFPDLPWVTPYSATLVDTTVNGTAAHIYCGEIHLTAGTTLATTMTTDASCGSGTMLIVPESGTISLLPFRSDLSSSVHRLCVAAPVTGEYGVVMATKEAGSFALEASATEPVAFTLSKLRAPSRALRTQTISVWATFKPGYNGWTYPVRFYFERRVGKKWKTYTRGKLTSVDWRSSDHTTYYSDGNRLKKAGTYRLRCKFSDAAHSPVNYCSRSFRVR
jgi:hypothetical protein